MVKVNARNEFSDLKRPRKHVSYDFLRWTVPILWWPWNPRWPPFDLETHLNGKSECQKWIQRPKKTQKTCIIRLSTMNDSHSMRWPWNPRWPPFDLETHLNGKSKCQKWIQRPKKTQKTCIIRLSTTNDSHSMRWPWNPRWPPFDL